MVKVGTAKPERVIVSQGGSLGGTQGGIGIAVFGSELVDLQFGGK